MKRKRLAMLMALVMTVTSVDGSMLLVGAAEQPEAAVQMDDGQDVGAFTSDAAPTETGAPTATPTEEEMPTEEEVPIVVPAETEADGVQIFEQSEAADEFSEVAEDSGIQIFEEETIPAEDLFTDDEAEIFSAGEGEQTSIIPPEDRLTVLSLDTNYPVNIETEGQEAWFAFTPSENGTYFFSSASGDGVDPYVYFFDGREYYDKASATAMDDDGNGSSNDFLLGYELEAGKTYYYCAQLFSNEATGNYTVLLSRKKEIASITVNSYQAEIVRGLGDSFCAEITYTYSDEAMEPVTENVNYGTFDSYKNNIHMVMTDAEGMECSLWDDLAAGTYTVKYVCGSVESEPCQVEVKELEDSSLYKGPLQEGENPDLESPSQGWAYYSFTPQDSEVYCFDGSYSNRTIMYRSDGGWNSPESSGLAYALEAGKTYYVGLNGEVWNGEEYGNTAVLNIVRQKKIRSITASPVSAEIIRGLGNSYQQLAVNIEIAYEDGETVSYPERTFNTWDKYGNEITFIVTDENNEICNDYYETWLEEGSYQVELSNGEVKAFCNFTVTTLDKAEIDTLETGTQKIQAGIGSFHYYRYTPVKSGGHILARDSAGADYLYISIYASEDGETLEYIGDYGLWKEDSRYDSFKEGTVYYIGFQSENGQNSEYNLTFTRELAATSVRITDYDLRPAVGAEKISVPKLTDFTAEVAFDDGTTKIYRYSDHRIDEFGNGLQFLCYLTEEGQETEYSGNWDELPAGDYVYRVFWGNNDNYEVYEDIPFTVLPMDQSSYIEIQAGETVTAENTEGCLIYKFVSGDAGRYEVEFNVPVSDVKVVDAQGEEKQFSIVNGSYKRGYVDLEAAAEYYIKADVDDFYSRAKVTVTFVNIPEEFTVRALQDTYIAGLDYLDSNKLETEIRYSDGSATTVRGRKEIQEGELTYRAVRDDEAGDTSASMANETSTGFSAGSALNSTVSDGDILDAGTYKVYTSYARFSSGSGINVDTDNIRVNPATITAEIPDIETLPALTENVWEDIPSGNIRLLYSFTAEKGGTYTVERDETGYCSDRFYLVTPEGLRRVQDTSVTLAAGETCVVVIYEYRETKIRVVSTEPEVTPTPDPDQPDEPGDEGPIELTVGMKKKVLVSEGGKKVICTFTPEESGSYVLSSEGSGDPYVELYCGENDLAYADDDEEGLQFKLYYYLEAGNTYTYQISSYSANSFYIDFQKADLKKIANIELELDDQEYNELTYLEGTYKITYEDGSTAEYDIGKRKDQYANSFEYSRKFIEATETSRIYEISLQYKGIVDKEWNITEPVRIEQKRLAALETLEAQKIYEQTPAAGEGEKSWYYQFTPQETGEYGYSIINSQNAWSYIAFYQVDSWDEGSDHWQITPEWQGENMSSVRLKKGVTYSVVISSEAYGEQPASIRYEVKKAKELKDLELVKLPDAAGVLKGPYDVANLSEMEVKAAYTDGTTENISYGAQDSLGRSLSIQGIAWLSSDICRVTVGLGNYRVSFRMQAASWTDLPEIYDNTDNSVETSVNTYNMFKFVPKQTGGYSFTVTNGYVAGPLLKEDLTYNSDSEMDGVGGVHVYYYLEAGKTYYVPLWVTSETVVIRPVYDGCIWVTTRRTEATCTEKGELVETCTLHGDSRTTEIPALGHDLKETVTEADCTTEGSRVTVCSRCDYTETEVIPALEHDWSAWTVTQEADCTNAGRRQRSCARCRLVEEENIPALGHDFSGELLIEEPTATQNGKKYYLCQNGCEKEKIKEILPATDAKAAVDSVTENVDIIKDAIKAGDVTAKERVDEINLAADALIRLDNEAIINSDAMNTVADVEELVVEANDNVAETIVDADTSDETLNGITVEGAALTAAAEEAPEGSVLAAKITVEKSQKDYTSIAPKTHALSIRLSVVNTATGSTISETTEPNVPLRITIPVPEAFQGKTLALIHIQISGEDKELTYVLNADGTMMTFTTPTLSDFVMLVKDCGDDNHEFGGWTVTKEATCTAAGEQERICETCGKKDMQIIQPAAHQFTIETGDKKEATCTEDGYTVKKCETCDLTKSFTEKALGHDIQESVTKGATCTEEGNKRITCTRCDYEADETIAKTEHSFTKENVLIPAACVAEGSKELICEICGETVTSVIPIDPNVHTFTWKTEKAATCGANGSRYEECTDCHAQGKTEVIRATGKHTYSAWVTTKAATALAAGTRVRTCTVCKTAKETGTIAKLKPTMQLTVKEKSTLPLKVKQSVTIKTSGLAKGDSVASWTSSNKKIATVTKSGKITGKKAGTAKITVKLKSGLTQYFKVKVQKSDVKTTSIKLNVAKKLTLKKGKTQKLIPTIAPITSKEKVTYKSSNTKIVTVSSKGVIKGKKKGKATITVKSGKKSVKVTVTVK